MWGIALEPFWPALNGSCTSPISVCWRLRISVAIRSSEPPRMAIAVSSAACRSRWTIWRAGRVGVQAEGGEDLGLDVGAEVAVRADRPGDLAGADLVDRGRQAGPAAVDLERPARQLEPERGRLGVDRMGAAHHRRVRLGPCPRDERRDEPVAAAQQPDPRGPELQGEPRVDDIAAGQP